MKNKNGITLVALVITIIILLILAGITISQLSGSGLFENAKLAEQKSKKAQEKEDGILSDYENKIGEYVDGTRDDETVTRAEFEALKTAVSVLQSNSNTHLIKRDWALASSALPAATWTVVETVSLAEYGTGKAIISLAGSTEEETTMSFGVSIYQNNKIISTDRCYHSTARSYMGANACTTVNYDENTQLELKLYSLTELTPKYTYSILLIPDNN